MTWEKFLVQLMARAWLVFEAPVLIVLLSLFVAYPGFDEPMRIAARGFLPLALGIFWVAAWHNIVVTRWFTMHANTDTQDKVPSWAVPAIFLGLRLLLLVVYFGWLIYIWVCR